MFLKKSEKKSHYQREWVDEMLHVGNKRGINAMSVSDLTGIDIPLSSLLEDARRIEDSVREVFENSQTMLPAPDEELDPSFG